MLFKAAYKYSYHKNIPHAILFAGYNENSNWYCCASFGKCIFHALLRQFPFACQLSAALNVRSRSCKRESGDMAIKNRNAQVNKKKEKRKTKRNTKRKMTMTMTMSRTHCIAFEARLALGFSTWTRQGRFYSVFGIDRRRAIKQKPIFS